MELPQNNNNTNEINENKESNDNVTTNKENQINENQINENKEKDKGNNNNDTTNNENKINENQINENIDLNLNNAKSSSSDKFNSGEVYYDEDYGDNYDEIDNVEAGQEEILETMFLNAKNSEGENKIALYLDIIGLDESKEKVWSYKCYQEICLIYLQFEDHYMFSLYYKQLMNTARTFDYKKLRPYIEVTMTEFLCEIKNHCKESISHWLEDLTIDFNRREQDRVINMFEANFNLKYLILSKGGSIDNNKENVNNYSPNNFYDVNIIEYLNDKDKLEQLTYDYLIKECQCNEQYLDKKGNTFFYFAPEDSKRGGEFYQVPVGWIAFGIEVTNKYGGNTDWLGRDGNPEEWAVAYHGFGARMQPDKIKGIIKTIVHDNLKPGAGQAYSGAPDKRHPGKKCGNGVYITPKLEVATQYAGMITLGNKSYRLVIMVRVNPSFIREPQNMPGYWIVDGNGNQLRPYRLLIKESNTINLRNNFYV